VRWKSASGRSERRAKASKVTTTSGSWSAIKPAGIGVVRDQLVGWQRVVAQGDRRDQADGVQDAQIGGVAQCADFGRGDDGCRRQTRGEVVAGVEQELFAPELVAGRLAAAGASR